MTNVFSLQNCKCRPAKAVGKPSIFNYFINVSVGLWENFGLAQWSSDAEMGRSQCQWREGTHSKMTCHSACLALRFAIAHYFQLYSDILFVKMMAKVCKEVTALEKHFLPPSKPPCSVTAVGGGCPPAPRFYFCGQERMNTMDWMGVKSHQFRMQLLGAKQARAEGSVVFSMISVLSLGESSTRLLCASVLPLVIICFNSGRGGAGLGSSLCAFVSRGLLEQMEFSMERANRGADK